MCKSPGLITNYYICLRIYADRTLTFSNQNKQVLREIYFAFLFYDRNNKNNCL